MEFLLVAINAKYIHSNPGVYSLRAYAAKWTPDAAVSIAEYTINHQMERVLQDLYEKKPDFVGFSCYIWNIRQVLGLVRDLHKVLPGTEIWLGGPEVSFDAERLLAEEPDVRGIMRGEGERTFAALAGAYLNCPAAPDFTTVFGITYRRADGFVTENPPQPLLSMDEIPFCYGDMSGFENRIVYYESSRGCPFSCSYCLSSVDKSVRFRSLELVKRELDFFLEKKVPQVKFVDRTFNCSREHTLAVWNHLLEHDNGITNFHFEISADLLDEEELAVIGRMRPGLIQLEIGVQSTNLTTVKEIHRTMDLGRLKRAVARVAGYRNTHQHLDLIAGLPGEDLESFRKSFDEVYAMRPDQLQLGFLKVLKGSYMAEHVEDYRLRYQGTPPYEVLCTEWLDYGDVILLKDVEEAVEVYYNSGQFRTSMELLLRTFPSAFSMYEALARFYKDRGLLERSQSRVERYEILYEFLRGRVGAESLSAYRDALMFDLYLRENAKSRPSFAFDQTACKGRVKEFFRREEKERRWLPGYEACDSRQLSSMAHLEAFEDGSFVLFDYKNRDPLNRNARSVRFRYDGGFAAEGDFPEKENSPAEGDFSAGGGRS